VRFVKKQGEMRMHYELMKEMGEFLKCIACDADEEEEVDGTLN
jgi:hypothetical protein